jgi:hypothetical protein
MTSRCASREPYGTHHAGRARGHRGEQPAAGATIRVSRAIE